MTIATLLIGVLSIVAAFLPLDAPHGAAAAIPQESSWRVGSVHRTLPSEIDPGARYLLYLHGRIIEDEGMRPTHPRFGVYEYEAILEELAARGFVVISQVRPPGADAMEHAQKTAQQVRELLAAGVPARNITVMGFSKGGAIAVLTSWELQEHHVRYVWLAACGEWSFQMSALVPAGRILSIYESSDALGVSCQPLFRRSNLIDADEIRIETGERHGAFYRPTPAWVEPAVAWLLRLSAPAAWAATAPGTSRRPDWVGRLGYQEDDLYRIRIGRFGFPFVLVEINGTTFDLPFDTGNMVGISLLPEEIEPLGLNLAESWDRLSSDGRVVGTFSSYSGATVEVWGQVHTDQTIYEFDDHTLSGLLGPEYLLGRRYTIDYKAGLMAITDRPLPDEIAGMESIPLVESAGNPGLILFHGTVHGRRVLMQADTGKSRGTVEGGLARDLGLEENPRGFRIDDLRIGAHGFSILSAKEVDLRAIDDSLDDPILVGIGSDVLSQIPVTIDYISGRLLLPVNGERRP